MAMSAFWAFIGYLSSNDPENISWSWLAFAESILIGAMVGGVSAYLHISALDATNLLASAGIPLVVHRIIKLILNARVKKLAAKRLTPI
jgi:hypothetical protein